MTFKAHPAKAGPSRIWKTFPWLTPVKFPSALCRHTHCSGLSVEPAATGAPLRTEPRHPLTPQSGSSLWSVCITSRPEGLRPG